MSRNPSVWFWKQKGIYCTTINGKRVRLSKNRRDADRKLKALLKQEHKEVDTDAISAILDDFLAWTYENRAGRTAERYQDFIQDFLDHCGDMPVSLLETTHVTAWLHARPTWNSTTKNNAITAVSRAFNWAVKNRGLKYNPIKGMDKPTPKKRTTVVTPEEFENIISHYKEDDPFQELLTVAFDCGCRPFEITGLEARHIEIDKSRAVLPAEEAKKGIQRAFYFGTERSMEIITKLVAERPTGPLFVNTAGTPWNGFNIRCRFQRLQNSGKVAKRYSMYTLRHSYITHKLVAGVDSHTVARLAGHQSTAQLDRTYSHIADDYEYMLRMAKKQIKNGASSCATSEPGGRPKRDRN